MEASKYASAPPLQEPGSFGEKATPPTETPDMGAFAQTRPPEDLFSDDFTPLAQPVVEATDSIIPTGPRQKSAQPQSQRHAHRRPQDARNNQKPSGHVASAGRTNPTETGDPASPQTSKSQAPTVRGDRTATGGAAKSKLTEEELNAKMQAMKVKNTELEQAHARSQADEESFRANEAALKGRQKQDRVNRQVMLTERERNAQRKMQAQQGRDWDVSKQEADIVDRPQRRPMRGAHGGVARDPAVESAQYTVNSTDNSMRADAPNPIRGGARGGRGRGRGAFRGGSGNAHQTAPSTKSQSVPSDGDFPALNDSAHRAGAQQPTSKLDTSNAHTEPAINRTDSYGATMTPAGEKSSWAEQMYDTPEASWDGNAQEQRAPRGGW
ncbi:MAG: hypothetical protein Q9162_004670 [Coniocarpon cinnabarinum]